MRVRTLHERSREHNPLPEGTLAVGAGLLVAGITAYAFLSITANVLGSEKYSGLSALWLLVFVAAPGCFLPVEQELGRALAARHARGIGGGPLIRRAALLGGVLAGVLLISSVAASGVLRRELFHNDTLLLVGFVLSLLGYFGAHLARGTFSGNGRFSSYGLLLGGEGVWRVVASLVLIVVGVETAGPYGIVVGLAPFAGLAVALMSRNRRAGLATPGPEAPWSELSAAMGLLLVGSILAQVLVNAAPLTVIVLASSDEKELASRFFAGVLVTRVPLFLFQAIQAALLPKLARLAAEQRYHDFQSGLVRLIIVVGGLGLTGTLGAAAMGPWVVRTMFDPEFSLGRSDLVYLAGGSAAFMVAVALAQALIALSGHARAAIGWIAGITSYVVVTALGSDLTLRAEQGFLAGAGAAVVVMGAFTLMQLRSYSAADARPIGHETPVPPIPQ